VTLSVSFSSWKRLVRLVTAWSPCHQRAADGWGFRPNLGFIRLPTCTVARESVALDRTGSDVPMMLTIV